MTPVCAVRKFGTACVPIFSLLGSCTVTFGTFGTRVPMFCPDSHLVPIPSRKVMSRFAPKPFTMGMAFRGRENRVGTTSLSIRES